MEQPEDSDLINVLFDLQPDGKTYRCGWLGLHGVVGEQCSFETKELKYKKANRAAHLKNKHQEWRPIAKFLRQMCYRCKALRTANSPTQSQQTILQLTSSAAGGGAAGAAAGAAATEELELPTLNRFSRGLLLNAVRHGIPFHALLGPDWQALFLPYTGCNIPSRWIATGHLKNMAEEKIACTKELLKSIPYLSLVTDIWTSDDKRSYMAIMGLYLDNEWSMQTILIDFVELSGRHTGEAIHSKLNEVCTSFGIDAGKTVVALVTDSASNNLAAIKRWREDLGLRAEIRECGDVTEGLSHVPCVAHMLHNGVNDALEVAELQVCILTLCYIYYHKHYRLVLGCRKYSKRSGL